MDLYDVRICNPGKLKETLNKIVYDGYEIDSYTLNKNDVFIIIGKMEVTTVEFKEITGIE